MSFFVRNVKSKVQKLTQKRKNNEFNSIEKHKNLKPNGIGKKPKFSEEIPSDDTDDEIVKYLIQRKTKKISKHLIYFYRD